MQPGRFERFILRRILGVSKVGLQVLIEKIENSDIHYKRVGMARCLAVTLRSIASSRLSLRRPTAGSAEILLCLEKAHCRDKALGQNIRILFGSEKGSRVHDLDSKGRLAIGVALSACVFAVVTACVYSFVSGKSRSLLSRVALARAKAWLAFQRILGLSPRKVVSIGMSYDLRRYFLSCWLAEKTGITSVAYISRAFLSVHDSMIADEVILGNEWVYEIRERFGAKLVAGKTTYLHNVNFPSIGRPTAANDDYRKNRVAFYSSGMYARLELSFGSAEYMQGEVRRESLLFGLLRDYAVSYPEVTIVIFPHPSVETEASASRQYGSLLTLGNVMLRPPGRTSAGLYDEFELGVSTGSNTIFERLEAGHKGLFVYPIQPLLVYKGSSLAPVVLEEAQSEPDRLDYFRRIDRRAFFELITKSRISRNDCD
jgi:hypothetical protein